MLILPPGHAQAVSGLRRLTAREKRLIGGVLAALALLAVALVIALTTSGQESANGCLHLTVPAATGAGEINECGVQARTECDVAHLRGALAPAAVPRVLAACRQAGLPTR